MGRPRKSSTPAAPAVAAPRRAGRKSNAIRLAEEEAAKKVKLSFPGGGVQGHVLTLGQGDTGQLGLGEDVMEKLRPALVPGIPAAVEVAAGGMHSVVLDSEGGVWTFGCNDEGSLGRAVVEEEECSVPGLVTLDNKVVQISAGDSHTAALTEFGDVWAWGTFRDSSGPIGLVEWGRQESLPVRVLEGVRVNKICSGGDHIAMLTAGGELWTLGNSEQGQLGRVGEIFSHRGGRRGGDLLLRPGLLHHRTRAAVTDIWAGSYNTVARTADGSVMVVGLNNYNQMGSGASELTIFMPELRPAFSGCSGVSVGQHHALLLGPGGRVSALGRAEYGRLGLGEDGGDAASPRALPGLPACRAVACGTAVSYAVTTEGQLFSWGMGTNGQLGTGEEEDLWQPAVMKSRQLEGRRVLAVSAGGQHTLVLARDN